MRKFLEYEKVQTSEEIDLGIPPEIFRLDVTGKSDLEIKKIVNLLSQILEGFQGYLHNCFHDEGLRKPCQREKLDKLLK